MGALTIIFPLSKGLFVPESGGLLGLISGTILGRELFVDGGLEMPVLRPLRSAAQEG